MDSEEHHANQRFDCLMRRADFRRLQSQVPVRAIAEIDGAEVCELPCDPFRFLFFDAALEVDARLPLIRFQRRADDSLDPGKTKKGDVAHDGEQAPPRGHVNQRLCARRADACGEL